MVIRMLFKDQITPPSDTKINQGFSGASGIYFGIKIPEFVDFEFQAGLNSSACSFMFILVNSFPDYPQCQISTC